MRYSAKAVANYFIEKSLEEGSRLDQMKLQKLVYYANGWYAGYRGEPLVDEAVEAWPYGPVFQSLYHEFKSFGRRGIDRLATDFDLDDFDIKTVAPPSEADIRNFLDNVWRSYAKYSGIQLSEMTHAPGSPWDQTRKATSGMRGADIPTDLIVQHFKLAVERANPSGK